MIEQLEVSGSHYEVGCAIGRRFGSHIHALFDNYGFLQERLLPFHRSPAGQALFRAFLQLHRAHFGGYVTELEGFAAGAERPFEEFLLVNLRGEYRGLLALEGQTGGCTDCLALTPGVALIGHNEDGDPAALGRMYVVHVQTEDGPGFSALCYPGFLPGNACGYNRAGVMHTVDAVSPRGVRVGLGRHFIARSLLDAVSLDDAIRRATLPGRSPRDPKRGRGAGFTYNIGSLTERRIVSVEMAPDRHHVHEVQGCYVHTNHYLHLAEMDQSIGASSRARLARAQALCAATSVWDAPHVLSVLGDETDPTHPIFRRAVPPDVREPPLALPATPAQQAVRRWGASESNDDSATLGSALYDLDARELRLYAAHPVHEPERGVVLAL